MPDGDGYSWYKLLADALGKPPELQEEYSKVPVDSWMRLVGLKRGPVPKKYIGLREQMEAIDAGAKNAAELSERTLHSKTSP